MNSKDEQFLINFIRNLSAPPAPSDVSPLPVLEAESEKVDEHKIWRKNMPWLYDLMICEYPDIPSQTVDIMPRRGIQRESNYNFQNIVIGTSYTRGMNYLRVSELGMPTEEAQLDATRDETIGHGAFGFVNGKWITKTQIPRKQIALKARCMPQKPEVVAVISNSAAISVFNTDHYAEQTRGNVSKCIALTGLITAGCGLSWNKNKQGSITSTSANNMIGIWDVFEGGKDIRDPLVKLKGHQSVVNDVEWHPKNETVLCSVSNDKQLLIWDSRINGPVGKFGDDSVPLTSLAFNLSSDFLIAIGSTESLTLWDFRSPSYALHKFQTVDEPVTRLSWSPLHENVLASCSGNRLNIWEVEKIGLAQTPEDEKDGPSELTFVHAGHQKKINDFAWSPDDQMVICSVSDDCTQVWKMASDSQDEDDEAKTTENL